MNESNNELIILNKSGTWILLNKSLKSDAIGLFTVPRFLFRKTLNGLKFNIRRACCKLKTNLQSLLYLEHISHGFKSIFENRDWMTNNSFHLFWQIISLYAIKSGVILSYKDSVNNFWLGDMKSFHFYAASNLLKSVPSFKLYCRHF